MLIFKNISSCFRLNNRAKLLISVGLMLILFSFANSKQGDMRVKNTDVTVTQSYDNYFIDQQDVIGLMTNSGEDVLDKESFKKIKFKKLEKQIKQNLFVEDVEVFRDVKGTLYAKVQQRKPIVRIARSFGYDFYLDAKGNIFPMSQKFTARVLIAEGPFMNKLLLKGFKKDKTYLPYLEFMKRIEKDEFLSAQIHQISIDELGRIKMYQQVGQQVIEFGYPDENLDKKFKKLQLFYERILPNKGWNAYTRVNLNFENQIICE